MGDRPNSLIQHLLKELDVVPPDVLRAEMARADNIDGHEFLTELIAREDVTAELAAQYIRPKTVGAYVKRADADTTAFNVHQLRAKDLAQALEAAPHPDVVAAALRRLDGPKCPIAITDAMFGQEPTWFTPEQAFTLVHAAPSADWHQSQRSHTALFARLGPDHARAVLQVADKWWVLRDLAVFDLPASDFAAAISRASYDTRYRPSLLATVRALLARSTDRATLALELRAGQGDRVRSVILDACHWFDNRQPVVAPEPWDLTPAVPPAATQPLAARELPLIQEAKSSDAATLTATTDRILAVGNENDVLALLANPALPLADRHRILEAIAEGTTPVSRDRATGLDVRIAYLGFDGIVAFYDDERATRLWAQLFPAVTLRRHSWEPFGGRASAPQVLRSWVSENEPDLPDRLDAAIDALIRPDELRELPCPHLWAVLPRSRRADLTPAATHALGSALTKVLADALADSPERWAAYHALAADFPGTLRELMDVCAALAV